MDEKVKTVRELIALLKALPEEQQDLPVSCYAEAGCASTPVVGIAHVKADRVMLEGY